MGRAGNKSMPSPASAKIPVEAGAEQGRQVRGRGHLLWEGIPPGAAASYGCWSGNKVACSALEVLKMQMYRNFRPSPSLLLGAEESSLNTARPGEEC